MNKVFEIIEKYEKNAIKSSVFQQAESDRELLQIIKNRFNNGIHKIESYSKSAIAVPYLEEIKIGLNELDKLINNSKNQFFRKKQIIFYEKEKGNFIYFVKKGKIKITKNAENGRELNLGIYGSNHFIGSTILFSLHISQNNAIALEDSVLCLIPIKKIENLIALYSDVACKFISILANEIIEKDELLLQIAYSSSRKRVAESLLHYSERYHPTKVCLKKYYKIKKCLEKVRNLYSKI